VQARTHFFGSPQSQRAPKRPLQYDMRRCALLGASLAVVGVVALGLSISFCQIFSDLCFSIILRAFAVVSLRFGIDPYLSITAACRGHCWSSSFSVGGSTCIGHRRSRSFSGRSNTYIRGRGCRGTDRCARFSSRSSGLGKSSRTTEQAQGNGQNTKLRFHKDTFSSCIEKAQTDEPHEHKRFGHNLVDQNEADALNLL
jgi:hypothetical protein